MFICLKLGLYTKILLMLRARLKSPAQGTPEGNTYLGSFGKDHILTYISAAVPTVSKAPIVKVLWEKFLQ